MTTHPSHPDQLIASALGVCWHSPTSDRWPCSETSTPPRFPDHCAEHANDPTPGKCGDCADARKARAVQAEEALPDYRLYVVKPLCGSCDDRWVETERGLARCPRCGPSAVAS